MKCKFCNDQTEYDWYEDNMGKWRLGIKLDINNYRPHQCVKQDSPKYDVRFPQRRGFFDIICEVCGKETRLSRKHYSEKNTRCTECQ